MINSKSQDLPNIYSSLYKLKALFELTKFRLTSLVVFSGAVGYLLGLKEDLNWNNFFIFCAGSFLITAAANTINQIIEIESDKLMSRTFNRPLPSGRLNAFEASVFALLTSVFGFFIIYTYINPLTAFLGLLSLVLYAFAYTPLKRVTPWAVFVGAFPGALPPLIGWVGATGDLSIYAFIIFGIQFIWQFPHFWAIAWVLDDDYKKAGIKLLPSGGGRNLNTAFQIMIYTLFLIPFGLLPANFGMTGITSAVVTTTSGVLFLAQTFYLMKDGSNKSAKKIMFGSFLYLPIVQIAMLLDKI
jgi:protoheme IX farnesyltransferase